MIKKIVPALWAILLLIALGYVIRVIRFTPVVIPEIDYVVTGATEMVSGPAAGSASTDSSASGTPLDSAKEASTESALSTGIEKMVEEAVDAKADPTSVANLKLQLEVRKEWRRRRAVIEVLPAYAERKDALKDNLREEFGDARADKIDALVARAKDLEDEFWAKGDFDSVASFDSIYEARAALEICLEADPRNESALRSMVSVVCSGWPRFLQREDFKSADPALRERDSEGRNAAQPVLMTLWNEHVSKKAEPTLEDLAVANDLLMIGPSLEEFTKLRETFLKEHPSGTQDEWTQAMAQWGRGATLPIADWLLEACNRKGPEWDFYAEQFARARSNIEARGFGEGVFQFWVDFREPFYDRLRYWGRPSSLFRGPEERAAKQQPIHILMKNMPGIR